MCGEKCAEQKIAYNLAGSPPRVRGKAAYVDTREGCVGITPACAGKRIPPPPMTVIATDHPRVCGEKICSMTD